MLFFWLIQQLVKWSDLLWETSELLSDLHAKKKKKKSLIFKSSQWDSSISINQRIHNFVDIYTYFFSVIMG